ncbi:MAG: RNA polymerase sigma-I factor [Sulfobacillus thermosulfidooxidans]|nr:MAG: RNA polymerase sigma-I factor [Sulfobacillus thermosulfidooxidans]
MRRGGVGMRSDPAANVSISLLARASSGDVAARDQLISEYVPFILKTASKVAGRYLHQGVDEEISVAMLAFNEAIGAYTKTKGSFVGFAQTVIKRRLIDYYRKKNSGPVEVLLSELEHEDPQGHVLQTQIDFMAHRVWRDKLSQEVRVQEIAELEQALHAFGMHVAELPKISPRHQDARQRAIAVSHHIAHSARHREYFWTRKELPIKDLVLETGISRKVIERHRKYIIAITLILVSDWPYLQHYVRGRIQDE